MSEVLRKYGAATTILFPLIDAGATDFESTPVTFAAGDTQISKDEGAFANTTNNPAHEGNGIYSLALTATEMQAARVAITIIDQTATKTWEDQASVIGTYGNASAQHAFDLDTASTAQTGDSFARLGAPAGASVSADIATVDSNVDAVLVDTGTTLDGKINTIDTNVDAILVDTGTTLDGKIDDIQGATFDTATDSLEAIRNRGDAAWITGAGGAPPTTLQNTTIATLASQTSFTLTAGSADDNAYNGAMAIIEDSATSTQKAIGIISDYTGSTKTVTLAADPGIFTMAAGDTIDIIANYSNLGAIFSNTTTSGNFRDMYNGTGYTDDTAPASREQVAGIGAATGGSTNHEAAEDNTGGAIKTVSFVGVQTSGTFASTEAEDGTYHQIDDTTNDIDIIYGFDIGGSKVATDFTFKGYLNGSNDNMLIQAYDFVGSDWETRVQLPGQAGTTNISLAVPLLSKHTGTGADLGKVYLRFEADGVMSNPTLQVDELLVQAVSSQTSIGYEGGAVWLDTNASNTNTESFVDGTADNPVSTIAAAKTIADNLNLKVIHSLPDSSFTLAASFDGFEFIGQQYTVALGGQSLSGTSFLNATITGNDDGTNGTATLYENCTMGTNTLGLHILLRCGLSATITIAEAGTYDYIQCHSRVAGTGTPSLSFGAAVGNTNLNMRRYSGGIQVENMGDTGTDTMSLEGEGQFVEGTCTSGTVAIRGHFTTSGVTNLTLSDDARIDVAQINAEADTALSDYDPPTKAELDTLIGTPAGADVSTDIAAIKTTADNIETDTQAIETDTQDIQSRLPAALVSGRMSSDSVAISGSTDAADKVEAASETMVTGTATGTPTTTTMAASGLTETTDDHYNGRVIIWTSGALLGQAKEITDYTGSTKTFTFTATTEAASASDTFVIV